MSDRTPYAIARAILGPNLDRFPSAVRQQLVNAALAERQVYFATYHEDSSNGGLVALVDGVEVGRFHWFELPPLT